MKKFLLAGTLASTCLTFSITSVNAQQSGTGKFKGRMVTMTVNGVKNVSCPYDDTRYCEVTVTISKDGSISTTVKDGGAIKQVRMDETYPFGPDTRPELMVNEITQRLKSDIGVPVYE